MNQMLVDQAARAIAARYASRPRVGLILGTGLGNLISEMLVQVEVPYGEIPYFPRSTAMAHKGHLLCGTLSGVPAIIMAGRCHLYEGYALEDLMLPVRVLHLLGIDLLIITNAAGGLNPGFQVGDVMVLVDHINLMFPGVTSGRSDLSREGASEGRQRLLPTHQRPISAAWPRQQFPYDPVLSDQAMDIARRRNFALRRGVYVGVKGPNYETRAEYRAFRKLGGDVVGMSTIPEVLCARALGLRVLGLSTVTNIACPDAPQIVTPTEVVAMAGRAEPKVRRVVAEVVKGLA
jgi:purine-nucleoside phosphorylase